MFSADAPEDDEFDAFGEDEREAVFRLVAWLTTRTDSPSDDEFECEDEWDAARCAKVGAAAVGGLGVCAVTGGLAAPAIGGAIGSAMGLSGAITTPAGLATLGLGPLVVGGVRMFRGTAAISGGAGLLGAYTRGK